MRDEAERPLRLSWLEMALCWAIAVAVFLFITGPIWHHAWDMDRFNSAVFWSYVPIPLLVAGCLLIGRKWSLRAMFLNTLTVTLLKYVSTFAFAVVLWEVSDPAKALAAAAVPHRTASPASAAPAVSVDPRDARSIDVRVVDAAGAPVTGAVVFVSAGVERFAFPEPQGVVEIADDGSGFSPELVVVRAGQRISARSSDGRLHTMIATAPIGPLFNVPLLANGDASSVVAPSTQAVATLHCNVHGDHERAARLVVLPHPLFATTDKEGRARIDGVPSAASSVAAVHGDARVEATLASAGGVELRLP